jgi:hypothetical protein
VTIPEEQAQLPCFKIGQDLHLCQVISELHEHSTCRGVGRLVTVPNGLVPLFVGRFQVIPIARRKSWGRKGEEH